MTDLTLCRGTLQVLDAEVLLADYLDPRNGHGWPVYDLLETNGSPTLVDADLLAPVLLNVHLDPGRFRLLLELLPSLQGIADLPPVALEDAADDVVAAVARLFAVLDEPRYARAGVRGSVLSKVLHRKRPDLVPLYDSRIIEAYTQGGAIPLSPHRSWVDTMELLTRQMRDDLRREATAFTELLTEARSQGAELTRLRLLDILVWQTSASWQ